MASEKTPAEQKRHLQSGAAAAYVGVPDCEMRRSRSTGILWGKPAPPYRRVGKSLSRALYAVSDLDSFLSQFPLYASRQQETRPPHFPEKKVSLP